MTKAYARKGVPQITQKSQKKLTIDKGAIDKAYARKGVPQMAQKSQKKIDKWQKSKWQRADARRVSRRLR